MYYILCFLLGFFGFGFYLRTKRIQQERALFQLLKTLQKRQVDELYGRTSSMDEKTNNK